MTIRIEHDEQALKGLAALDTLAKQWRWLRVDRELQSQTDALGALHRADFRLLVDPGHDTFLELLKIIPASAVDAVFVSHGHADHCADLNPLLRARHLSEDSPPALPLFALAGALDAVLTVPEASRGSLASAPQAGEHASAAGVGRLVLSHLWPDTDLRAAERASGKQFTGLIAVAVPGLRIHRP